MNIRSVALIGIGGGGSCLLQALAPTFETVFVIDGDKYEEKNMARQPMTVVGQYKADVAAERFGNTCKIVPVTKYITGSEDFDVDLFIAAVDNNEAREAAKMLADKHKKPLIIIANEVWEPMAFLYKPEYQHTKVDPFKVWDLANIPETVLSCEEVDNPPEEQTALANLASAGLGATIIESMKQEDDQYWVIQAMCTPYPNYKTIKNILYPRKKVEA